MPVTTETSFEGDILAGIGAPTISSETKTKWQTNLINAGPQILAKATAKMPDESGYLHNLVSPSVSKWAPIATALDDADFVSKKGKTAPVIVATRTAKMQSSYD